MTVHFSMIYCSDFIPIFSVCSSADGFPFLKWSTKWNYEYRALIDAEEIHLAAAWHSGAFLSLCFLIHQIFTLDISIVQEKSDEALRKQSEIVAKSKNIAIEKEKIEMTIIEALQPLKAAKLALIEFKKDTIADILEMETSPPEDVEVVGECFLILKGIRDVSWKSVRTAMLDEDYFKCLSDINCDLISLKQLSQCKGHLKVSDL